VPALLLAALTAAPTLTDAATLLAQAEAQIEWVRSRGGFVHPSIQVRPLFPDMDNAPLGVFATTPLKKGETLIILTPDSLFQSESGSTCDLVRKLIRHSQLGNHSEYAPYVQYILDDATNTPRLPSAWSQPAKDLIETIAGKELPPESMTGLSIHDECHDDEDNDDDDSDNNYDLEQEAYLTVRRRSWDHKMLPVFDMLNHRNGRWTNVHSTKVHHDDPDHNIKVYATRDIQPNEQLHLSYNECADCDDFRMSYGMPEMVRDFAFIEDYPQRFVFWCGDDSVVLQLDENNNDGNDDDAAAAAGKPLQLSWITVEPQWEHIHFFRGHLQRLRNLHDHVHAQAALLTKDSHAGWLILEYYKALLTVLEYAVDEFAYDGDDNDNDDDEQECSISASGEQTCKGEMGRSYKSNLDELQELGDQIYNHGMCIFGLNDSEVDFEDIDYYESQYQTILYQYNPHSNDTCLALNDHLQTCTSFRPHYHEVFVHYPARYVERVQRVAFIGGGDNMIVHEILKYPSLELVVGMELDHHVVRRSFKHFGTQPHWDDPRLQWWFGDGSQSLLMLPPEYYGSFDLVLLDLQTEVAEFLKVTDELNIMQAAMLLLKPDGVIARNEDWDFGTANPFSDYAVDLYYADVPRICVQGITMGSNSVNFLKKTPKAHDVDTVYLDPFASDKGPFGIWYNYVHQSTNSPTNKLCKDSDAPGEKILTDETVRPGVLMILEVENADSLETSSMEAAVSNALKSAGLTQLSVALSATEQAGGGCEIIFILEEGYAAARTWPEHKYCAFDLLLWSKIGQQETAKAELVSAVGGKLGKSTSSYRIVTAGMFGTSEGPIGPKIIETCEQSTDHTRNANAEKNDIDAVLEESSSLFPESNVLVVVLCGQESLPCESLGLLAEKFEKNGSGQKVVPVWACPNFATDTVSEDDESKLMFECHRDTLHRFVALGDAQGKIGGIVIDPTVSRGMGQIVHKVLSRKKVRTSVLSDNHVVLAIALDSSGSWHRAFLDRFRTDFARWDPAYRLEAVFNSTNSSFELGVFSSGDDGFYSHAVNMIARIEEKTSLISEVRKIVNGINNYVAEFEPSKISSNDDYDFSLALEQWEFQHPLGEQTIIHFARKPESSAFSTTQITDAFQNSVREIEDTDEPSTDSISVKVGDGSVNVAFWSEGGSIIASWDGRDRITCYFFSAGTEEDPLLDHFADLFLKKIPSLFVVSRDALPRGIGRTVNFAKDLLPSKERPQWA
jgi:spermidine synthase/S-adenosylmethionine/arginine decarboxylase-like enzyme